MAPIIAKDTRGGFTPPPEGLHQGVCVDVIDLGIQQNQWGELHQVELRWELEVQNEETERPHLCVKRYRLSLHEKATLRHHLEAWRGRKFNAEELAGFDLEKLIGVNCQVQIVHTLRNDGSVFGTVQAIVPLGRGMTKLRPSSEYTRVKDRPQPSGNGGTATTGDDAIPF